jgi:HSP90 family molecular chaperone
MDKREVSEEQYEMFYENLNETKLPYKFKLHYSADVPISIKAIFFLPSHH